MTVSAASHENFAERVAWPLKCALAIALLAGLALPVPAPAATVSSHDSLLDFRAGPGESNRLFVYNLYQSNSSDFAIWRIRDEVAPVRFSGFCAPAGKPGDDASCKARPSLRHSIAMGDEDDEAFLSAPGIGATLHGGSGDDRLDIPGGRSSALEGGPGNDVLLVGWRATGGYIGYERDNVLSGGFGADEVYARNGVHDVISCGPGDDRVSADPGLDEIAEDCEWVE